MSLQYIQVCTKMVIVQGDPTNTPQCAERGWVQAEIELSSEAAPWASGEQLNQITAGVIMIFAVVFIYSQIKKAIEM